MAQFELKIQVKHNKNLSIFISPSKDSDIYWDKGVFPHKIQLLEGKRYYYELDDPNYYIDGDPIIITQYSSRSGISNGTISTGNYVGTLTSDIKLKSTAERVGIFSIEIRSVKLGYEGDYRKMMGDITEFCIDLLMQQSSPVTQNYIIDEESDPQTDYERFAFVKSIIQSDSFEEAISQIESNPLTKWDVNDEERAIERVRKIGNYELKQFARSNRRVELTNPKAFNGALNSVPSIIHVKTLRDTSDVPENQFIKFVLNSFLGFCLSVRNNKFAQERLKSEADEVCQILFKYLSYPFFRNLSDIKTLPLGSPVLQKRSGYREILQKWLMFDMAAKLSWEGGEDVYSVGQKNVARLYEYWLFFKLLEIFSQKFAIPHIEKSKLLQKVDGNLCLCLKEGKMQVLRGSYEHKGRRLNISFAYNRTFRHTREYSHPGSWSRQMRPDYTLSIWPEDISCPDEAERLDLITHIHFDAKYRVEHLISEFNRENTDDLSAIKHEEEQGCYKRADLLKMHAYKDAIKRSAGAYVLYPGISDDANTEIEPFINFHEIIPGLGAFAISPRNPNIRAFSEFIDLVIDNFINRTSQRERMQHHRYKDLQTSSQNIYDHLPEPHTGERTLPDETYVLVGYTRPHNTNWVHDKLLYPVRIGANVKGSVILDKNIISSQYLLSYNKNGQQMYKIDTAKGVKILTKNDLSKQPYEYPNPKHDNYMLFSLLEAEEMLTDLDFDLEALNRSEYDEKVVFAVLLSDLMNCKLI